MEPPIREDSPVQPPPPPVLDGQLHLLLGDFQRDDVSRYRRREAAWVSLAVHVAIVLLLIFMPRWSARGPIIVSLQPKKDTTFIPLDETPPITVKPPKTNIVSDQDRIAQAKTPLPDNRTLKELYDARRAGRPKPPQAPPEPAAAQPPQQAAQNAPVAPQSGQQQSQLPAPAPSQAKNNPFAIRSPGSSVNQAIQSVARGSVPNSSPTYGTSGDFGAGLHPKIDKRSQMEILSDTKGVDFGPYMKRLVRTVTDHWEPLIPEVALPPVMKRGIVVIEFAVLRDGTIPLDAIRVVRSSGDVSLDTAAVGALRYSSPLNALPQAYVGDYFLVRGTFFYNPETGAFE